MLLAQNFEEKKLKKLAKNEKVDMFRSNFMLFDPSWRDKRNGAKIIFISSLENITTNCAKCIFLSGLTTSVA